ncbi:EAL domain, c-di-GMP-specific phosphodiesterase class I (Or its enzymatically inactive variant) [Sandaracinus amylolyticus]|nr:EAL domain, c-di-GMP-specific phosphodiesterase class I (Or its enzymatically inactive variant) [Sandaracinus amylolyticus]
MGRVSDAEADDAGESVPWLEHRAAEDEDPIRITLERLPFRIGRAAEADFVIHSTRVSKEHAEIDRRRNTWVVRDLGSRNGTFVNGERVTEPRRLRPGDVVHVANRAFSFHLGRPSAQRDDATVLGTSGGDLVGVRDLALAISQRRVHAVFQPIVDLATGALRGYECLGRCDVPREIGEPPRSIGELFRSAEAQGRAAELSRLLREVQLADAPLLAGEGLRFFLNVHPAELEDDTLIDALAEASQRVGQGRLTVIEVHESTITDLAAMGRLRERLRERAIEIAYDDFGAGQSRLRELAEVPPDFIKLDLSLVRDIDQSPARRDLVAALTRVMRDLGIRVLAEGIETQGERDVCLEIGCELGQGYLIARPARVSRR